MVSFILPVIDILQPADRLACAVISFKGKDPLELARQMASQGITML